MQPLIREKRKLNFSNKVITPEIIRRFAKIIESESQEREQKGSIGQFVIYSIDAIDNSSYESQSSVIFKEGEIIDSKVIQKVQMRFQSSEYDKNIEIQFQHAQKKEDANNFILVSGDDTTWVNGIINRFSEIIELSQAQPKARDTFDYFVLPVTVAFNILYFRLFYKYIEQISSDWIKLVFVLGVPIGSYTLFNYASEYLKNLWPSVELRTGPEYLQIPSEKRRKVKLVASVVVIPLLLGLIYDLLKSWLNVF